MIYQNGMIYKKNQDRINISLAVHSAVNAECMLEPKELYWT